mmetsp:Transcript_37455/g.96887  ORF Transcript_37455/g.96887 Transcript_37455/m.96887 type:complete len:216 (-) Transcript_37455:323-970(-)
MMESMCASAVLRASCARAVPSDVLVSAMTRKVSSSALSTSTSARTIFSSSSEATLWACCRMWKSFRTCLIGVSLVCASFNECCSLPSSLAVAAFAIGANLFDASSLALRKPRASLMASCAAFADFSVSLMACPTVSASSPQLWIISVKITVFSVSSSARLVFCTASLRMFSSSRASCSSFSELAVVCLLSAISFSSKVALVCTCIKRHWRSWSIL